MVGLKTGRRGKRLPRYEDKAIAAAPEDRADAPAAPLCGHCGRETRTAGAFCGARCAILYWQTREG